MESFVATSMDLCSVPAAEIHSGGSGGKFIAYADDSAVKLNDKFSQITHAKWTKRLLMLENITYSLLQEV